VHDLYKSYYMYSKYMCSKLSAACDR